MKKISIIAFSQLVLLVAVGFFLVPIANAAEITPNPDTYSYGSTSELAPSVTIQTQGSSSSNLAGTGESAKIIQITAGVLLIAGLGLVARLFIQKRQTKEVSKK